MLQRCSRCAADAKDDVWREGDQLCGVTANAVEIAANFTGFDFQIAAGHL